MKTFYPADDSTAIAKYRGSLTLRMDRFLASPVDILPLLRLHAYATAFEIKLSSGAYSMEQVAVGAIAVLLQRLVTPANHDGPGYLSAQCQFYTHVASSVVVTADWYYRAIWLEIHVRQEYAADWVGNQDTWKLDRDLWFDFGGYATTVESLAEGEAGMFAR